MYGQSSHFTDEKVKAQTIQRAQLESSTSQSSLLCTIAQPYAYSSYGYFLASKHRQKQICTILKENRIEISHAGLSLTPEHF